MFVNTIRGRLFGALLLSLAAVGPVWAAQEAPALQQQVAAGTLPAVDERLPLAPMVLTPRQSVGTYGGDLRLGMKGVGDFFLLIRSLGYEPLVAWDSDWSKVVPNVAESFEVNDNATEFTFRLREGTKWSDGVPLTADDIMFWYEDVTLNTDLRPSPPARMQINGETVKLTKIDDYTVKFSFTQPNGLFLQYIAYNRAGVEPVSFPRHYFEQFHLKYNPDANKLAAELGYSTWVELFKAKASELDWPWRFNAEVPVLHAWQLTESIGKSSAAQQIVAQRNPYYFKVDTEGNQLPYLDRVVYSMVQDDEVLLLKALDGEIDFQDRNISIDANKATLFDGQEAGGYRIYDVELSDMNTGIVVLNLTHPEPAKREVFQNKDFRIALSHAINRQEIIDIVHLGVGEPWQAAPRPGTPIYNEAMAKQYTEYDPAKANQILDGILPNRGANGMRTLPDGSPLAIVFEITDAHGLRFPDVAELVTNYWRAVGIDTQFRVVDRSLWDQRRIANVIDATIWRGFGGSLDAFVDARWYVPVFFDAIWATPWGYWYDGRDGAQEPPQAVKDHQAIYTAVLSSPSLEAQVEKYKELLEVSAEQF
ncbi:MAG: ABC transporter substrate-binding protein, partial [Hyphomicrobiales bacterium]